LTAPHDFPKPFDVMSTLPRTAPLDTEVSRMPAVTSRSAQPFSADRALDFAKPSVDVDRPRFFEASPKKRTWRSHVRFLHRRGVM